MAPESCWHPAFRPGQGVVVAERAVLEGFTAPVWTIPPVLSAEHLKHAGELHQIEEQSYSRADYTLYRLSGVDGLWYEECLLDSLFVTLGPDCAATKYEISAVTRESEPCVEIRTKQGKLCVVLRNPFNESHAQCIRQVAKRLHAASFPSRYGFIPPSE